MEAQVVRVCEEEGEDLYRTENAGDKTIWEDTKREDQSGGLWTEVIN